MQLHCSHCSVSELKPYKIHMSKLQPIAKTDVRQGDTKRDDVTRPLSLHGIASADVHAYSEYGLCNSC